MRVIIINFSSSGLYHYAACLVNSLAKLPDTELLFFTSTYNNLDLISHHDNLKLITQPVPHRLPGFFRWLLTPNEQLRLYREIKRFAPDIIHLTDSHAACLAHAWWLKKYPIVFTQHDPVSHSGDVFPLASKVIHATEQFLAQKIVVHGRYLKNILIQQGQPTDKIIVIPHGDYSFLLRWQKKPAPQPVPNSILFFGRIVDYKGLDVLLRSLIILQDKGRPVTLILAGAGDLSKYQPHLDQLDRKMIDNRIIPESDIINYFQIATVLAIPYREASQSGIISIAMPAKIPIVATRVGALPEVLEHRQNSLLVQPGQPAALAEALEQILDNHTLRQTLIAGALKTVRAKIAWPIVARQYRQLYQSIL